MRNMLWVYERRGVGCGCGEIEPVEPPGSMMHTEIHMCCKTDSRKQVKELSLHLRMHARSRAYICTRTCASIYTHANTHTTTHAHMAMHACKQQRNHAHPSVSDAMA